MESFPQEVIEAWPCLAGSWPVLERVELLERSGTPVFPPKIERYSALIRTPQRAVRAVILGQDPYHGAGQANGMAFSVPSDLPLPPSLRNIFQELESDLGGPRRTRGDLSDWADQGVLLLNTSWSVEPGKPGSHLKWGWDQPVLRVLDALNQRNQPVVFIAWGQPAQKKLAFIRRDVHAVLESAHPSPLGAYRGFWGSKPFSQTNAQLTRWGLQPVDWNGYL